jgi:hypothetical protein
VRNDGRQRDFPEGAKRARERTSGPGHPARRVPLEEIRQELDRVHRALALDESHALIRPVARYSAAEGWHEVLIAYHPALRWRVVDRDPKGNVTPVERLSGAHDLRRSAIACARDYAVQHCADGLPVELCEAAR